MNSGESAPAVKGNLLKPVEQECDSKLVLSPGGRDHFPSSLRSVRPRRPVQTAMRRWFRLILGRIKLEPATLVSSLCAVLRKAGVPFQCERNSFHTHKRKNAGGILRCGPTRWSWAGAGPGAAGPALLARTCSSIQGGGGQRAVSKRIEQDGGTHRQSCEWRSK